MSTEAAAEPTEVLDKHAERMKRFKALHNKRNEARKLNHAEVVEEDRKSKLPSNYNAVKKRQQWQLEEMEAQKAAEAAGEDYDRVRLLDVQADIADKVDRAKRRKANPDQGFSDYEAASLRKYNRLTNLINPDLKKYDGSRAQTSKEEFYPNVNTLIVGSHYPSTEAMDKMADDMKKQEAKHGKYSRRRTFDPDAPIDFINERNRKFNDKIDRFYSKYTDEIKQNLERGTAVD